VTALSLTVTAYGLRLTAYGLRKAREFFVSPKPNSEPQTEEFMYPADLKYTKEHEWIRIDGDTGTVGITDFAQQQLGDVVYVDLPEVGTKVSAGQPFGTIESVKAVSELFAPVSGEVTAVNTDLKDHPEHVNTKPHETWMVKFRLSNASEAGSLLDSTAYQSLTAG
jgi:glycine cleavage system H protein